MLSTALQWAGPAQVILVTGLGPGTVLIETAVAVALSSVRFLPIVVSVLPLVRRENSSPWQLLVPVHFMAISVWVEAMRHAPGLPREHRIPFCNGIGTTLLRPRRRVHRGRLLHAVAAAGDVRRRRHVHHADLVSDLDRAQRQGAAGQGGACGSASSSVRVLALNHVPFDLLWTGIIAGTLAYGLHRVQRARAATTDATP